jgi:hypothetical protein
LQLTSPPVRISSLTWPPSKLESTRIIDIEKFVPRESIDRLYWDAPYHLLPDGKTGIEAFAVIREAMKQKKMVAIGRLVMSTRERICALEIEEGGLLADHAANGRGSARRARTRCTRPAQARCAHAGYRGKDH